MDAPKLEAATRRRFRIKIDDLIWQPAERGAFYTNVYNVQAGEVVLRLAQRQARVPAAGSTPPPTDSWASPSGKGRTSNHSKTRRFKIIRWWKKCHPGTPPAAQAAPAAPAKRRPGRPRSHKSKRRPVKADARTPSDRKSAEPLRTASTDAAQLPAQPCTPARTTASPTATPVFDESKTPRGRCEPLSGTIEGRRLRLPSESYSTYPLGGI